MSGPACEVLFDPSGALDYLEAIDAILSEHCVHIERTRKGRVWDMWMRGRPIHVCVVREEGHETVELSSGCNEQGDYAALTQLSNQLALALGGVASGPEEIERWSLAMSPELEVLDQLLDGDMPLASVCRLFPNVAQFRQAVLAMLEAADVALLDDIGSPVPPWQWQAALQRDLGSADQRAAPLLRLTDKGAKRVS